MANNLTKFDADQVIRSVYDEDSNSLNTNATIDAGGGIEVIINHEDDSIRLGDGTNFLTSTTVGPKVGLDVAVINSIPLPAGAATEAKQDVGNASLASIDSKIVTVDTDNVTVVNGVGASSVNIQDGGNSLTVDAINLDIRDLSSVTDSVSAVVTSSTLPTGAATEAKQDAGNASLVSIDSKLTSPITVTGPLTDAQLRATPVDVNVTSVVASNVTVNNGAGAAAVNIQDGGNSITIDGTVAATQSGTWNINNISGTVSLPTGAATLAEQQTQTASLSVIDDWDESDRAKVNPIVGQAGVQGNTGAVSATTQRVTLATDIALPTGTNSIGAVTQATAANFNAQVVGNIADNGVDSGNPVKVGAIFTSTVPAPVYASGDRSTLISDNVGNLYVNASGRKPSYSAATTFTAAASATDVFVLTGSATKTIRVRQITVSGTNTGNTNALIDIVKRSTANTAGTPVTVTAVPNDSSSGAATATLVNYTANPTLGTAVGTVANGYIFLPTLASTNQVQIRDFQLFSNITEPIVLRGTTQSLSVNFRGVALGGTTVLATKIEWTEE